MDAKVHQFGTAAAFLLFLGGVGVGARDILIKPRTPAPVSINPVIPKAGEFRSTQLEDGSRWALIKIWGYKYDPNFRPNIDLAVIKEAIDTGLYSGFILEDDSIPPVWGWKLILDPVSQEYVLEAVTDQTVRNNQELFDKFRESNKRKP